MLILTRRVGELIKINDDITITLIGIKGNQAKIGFTAPPSVTIHRKEIYDIIQAEGNKKCNNVIQLQQPKQEKPVITVKSRKMKGMVKHAQIAGQQK